MVAWSASVGLAAALLVAIGGAAPSSAALPTLVRVPDGAVSAFATIGNTAYVGGTFTKVVRQDGTAVAQPRLFAYNLTTGALVSGFRPKIDGPVTSLAAAADGKALFVGGSFTTVNGATRRRVVKLNLDGSVNAAFNAVPSAVVTQLAVRGNRLFIGGRFLKFGSVSRPRLAEVSADTGKLAAGFNLPIDGTQVAQGGYVTVHSLNVNPDGTTLLVAHNGQTVGGQQRYGIALIDISGSTAKVLPWRTDLWVDNIRRTNNRVRITDAAWGPSGTWFVASNAGGDLPPVGDTVVRFDLATAAPAEPTWITRQFDSTYSIAVGGDSTVYTGGHFRYTEAPGSAEPWPGETNVNYGFGPTGGARVLGSQVVERGQLSALDPATGKARNWHAVASGHHGVAALHVVGKRLLVGHDGNLVGGRNHGRHGILETFDAPRDTSRPLSTVTSPLMGAVGSVGTQRLLGTASAPSGATISRVQVEVKRGSTWLQPDGTWAARFSVRRAALDSAGASRTGWRLDVPLPEAGTYVLLSKAVDSAGRSDAAAYRVPIQILDPSNSPPSITISYPAKDQSSFPSATITASGRAADPDGVKAVDLAFYNLTRKGYLLADGSFGDYHSFAATLGTASGDSRPWSLRVTLAPGKYTMFVNALDSKGAALPRAVGRSFTMP